MATHQHMEELLDRYRLNERTWTRGRNIIALLAVAGWAGCVLGAQANAARFFQAYLVAFLYFWTIAFGAQFFVMIQHVTGAAWSVTLRRMAENMMLALPWAAVLFLPVAFGLPYLYEWAHPRVVAGDAVLEAKAAYFSPGSFYVRAAIYFAVWTLWALRLYRLSASPNVETGLARAKSAERWSAPGILLSFVTVSLASFDWVMSLNPHWYSTMFGVYIYAGGGLAASAALMLILLAFRRADVLRYSVNHEHYHDLGKWTFALVVFWAYIAFSQYMLIWYANLPEETFWFKERIAGDWIVFAKLLVAGQFFAPFLLLLSRGAKRRLGVLTVASVWLLAMHYVDLYWVVMPAFSKNVAFHWVDAASFVAVGSSMALAFWWPLRNHALAPTSDIRFAPSLEFENV